MTTRTTNQKRKRLRNKADKLFQEVCLLLSDNCECCPKKAQVSHHFVPKSLSNNLRYNIDNGITLCFGCHFTHHTKYDPEIYAKMTENKPPQWFTLIRTERDKLAKTTLAWYQGHVDRLTKLKKDLES